MVEANTLKRYRQVAQIASGGMATVSLAEDTLLGRPVALKRLRGTGDTRGVSRLRREALVGASVAHPNLVSIYDVVAEDDDLVIVMEYVDGETLRARLKRIGRLSPREALRILGGVASGLDAIHQRGIVHRDVKPPNILLGNSGSVKLADLGIASAPDRTRITSTGAVLGSFSYMSPEQLEAGPATPAMDIYALAAVAYEILSGQRARRETNPMALAHAISTRPAPDLAAVWPEAPNAAVTLLKRGMSRDPAERPKSAGELVQRLQAALAPLLAPPRVAARPRVTTPGRPSTGRRPRIAPIGAAAAGAAGAAGAAAAAAAAASSRTARTIPATPSAAPPAPGLTPTGRAAAPSTQSARRPTAAAAPTAVTVANQPPAGTGARKPPGAASEPASRAGTARSRRSSWLAPLLVGLAALAVVAAVVLATHGSKPASAPQTAAVNRPRHKAKAARRHSRGKKKPASAASATSFTPSVPAAGSAAAGSGTPAVQASDSAAVRSASPAVQGGDSAAASPVSSVEQFYGLAAAHHFAAAWALADPAFRNQLGGYDSFVSGQQGDERIIFDSAQTVSSSSTFSSVAIRTTSIRTNGTQHCAGTVDLVRGSGSWLLHQIHINCSPPSS